MKKCLIYLERNNEKYAVDLLAVADMIYSEGYESYALSVHSSLEEATGCFDHIIHVEEEKLPDYDIRNIAVQIKLLHAKLGFDSILIPATYRGRMLAPRLAMLLETGLVADVTDIGHREGELMMIRPAFSGKIMAGITNPDTKPIMMSIRPGVFTLEKDLNKDTRVQIFEPETYETTGIRQIARRQKPDSADIRDSEVLVSGGGGIAGDMPLLGELADRLDGMVSASRSVVDKGKADRSIQVGQSGKIVHPRLYIAAGIYGAIQHIAGLNKVEHLISINTNPNAPICALSDIIVEGDAKDFITRLIAKIDEKVQ